MRIALNLLYLVPGVGGTDTYAPSLIRALARQDDDHQYSVFVNRETADIDVTPAANFKRIVCPIRASNRAARYSWEQGAMPIQLRRVNPDVVHSMGYVIPLAAHGPQVVSVPDVRYIGKAGLRSGVGRAAFRFFAQRTVKRADRVIVASGFSRDEIIRQLRVKARKVTVIHSAGREASAELKDSASMSDVVRSIPRPYIMAFGTPSAQENIPRLIAAFGKVSSVIPHDLVLVGDVPVKAMVLAAVRASGATERIHFTDQIPERDVAAILKNASLFVLPSLNEGFGAPLLDAQNAGIPVACSAAGGLPEIAGDSALFFDPRSEDELATALKRGLLDTDLRETLVEKGQQNARGFSWERAARETLAVYYDVAA